MHIKGKFAKRRNEKASQEQIDYASIPAETAKQFNDTLRKKRSGEMNAEEVCEHAHTLAQNILQTKQALIKKTWVTEDTMKLISQKHQAGKRGNPEEFKSICKQVSPLFFCSNRIDLDFIWFDLVPKPMVLDAIELIS